MRVSAPLSNPAQAVGQVLSMFVLHLPASRTSVSQWHTAIRTIEFISASNYLLELVQKRIFLNT